MSEASKTLFSETTENLILIGRTTADKMKLFIDVSRAPEGQSASRSEILEALDKHVDTEMVNLGVIDDIVQLLNSGEEEIEVRRIMTGRQPKPGADGKILLLKKQYAGEVEVQYGEEGKADYTKLHLFDNVKKGDVVARLYPPSEGANGIDVAGGVIKATAGKPYQLRADKSLSLEKPEESDKNYEIIVAQSDGYLVEENSRLCIKDELVIKGDLGYRYGAINFIGSVVVKGDVLPGFNITAGTGIEIAGSVRGGNLVCKDGDIVVKGFVHGGNKSKIICGKSFKASVVQEANAEIFGDIEIEKEARDSLLRTSTSLLMSKGSLMGGETFAVCGVEAERIGSEAGVNTQIHLCTLAEATLEYGKLQAKTQSHQKVLQMLRMHMGPYAENPARIQLLKPAFRKKMEDFSRKLKDVRCSLAQLELKQEKLLGKTLTSKTQRVNFLSKLFSGVTIKAGEAEFSSHEEYEGPQTVDYDAENQSLTLGELQPVICVFESSLEESSDD